MIQKERSFEVSDLCQTRFEAFILAVDFAKDQAKYHQRFNGFKWDHLMKSSDTREFFFSPRLLIVYIR